MGVYGRLVGFSASFESVFLWEFIKCFITEVRGSEVILMYHLIKSDSVEFDKPLY